MKIEHYIKTGSKLNKAQVIEAHRNLCGDNSIVKSHAALDDVAALFAFEVESMNGFMVTNIHQAQTGTYYVTVEREGRALGIYQGRTCVDCCGSGLDVDDNEEPCESCDTEFIVRIADHGDAYGTSNYTIDCLEGTLAGALNTIASIGAR